MSPALPLLTVIVSVGAMACGPRPAAAGRPICGGTSHREWNEDSSFALCVPDGFRRADRNSWVRVRRGSASLELLTVELIHWPEDSAQLRSWPLRLAAGADCRADCIEVDSVAVYVDMVAAFVAHTETGLLSGGFAGLRREPHLVMTWTMSAERRGFAQARTASPATLDTVREAVRSLWLAQ